MERRYFIKDDFLFDIRFSFSEGGGGGISCLSVTINLLLF